MNNREFDDYMKKSLDELTSEGKSSWTSMSEKIDEWNQVDPLIGDTEFDQIIKDRLEEKRSVYELGYWLRFEKILNKKFTPLRELIFYQLSGAVILILLLLLLFQLFPKSWNNTVETIQIKPEIETNENGRSIAGNAGNIKSQKFQKKDPSKTQLFVDHKAPVDLKEKSTNGIDPGNRKLKNLKNSKPIISSELNLKNLQNNILASANDPSQKLNTESRFINPVDFLKPLNYLSDQIDPIFLSNGIMTQNSFDELTDKSQLLKYWSVGFHVIPQLVYVHSPFNEEIGEAGYERWFMNTGIGTSLQYTFSKWRISTGLDYHTLSYKPRFYEEYVPEEQSYIHIRDIQFNLLNIPLNLRYRFIENGAFNFYGIGGASIGLITKSSYSIEKRNDDLISLINDLKTNPNYKNIALAQKQYDPGLMTGGQVSQNTLIRLELGLGFEYKIHSRLFGFIEPQFQFNMRRNNYGPNLDQIHTLSFKSGISILLN